jgi:FtsH-binding integral membrane protein
MIDNFKFFLKMWSYFICFGIGLALVVWLTTLAGNYSFVLGLFVFFVGVGGLISALFAIGLR